MHVLDLPQLACHQLAVTRVLSLVGPQRLDRQTGCDFRLLSNFQILDFVSLVLFFPVLFIEHTATLVQLLLSGSALRTSKKLCAKPWKRVIYNSTYCSRQLKNACNIETKKSALFQGVDSQR
jgi:hypothetical protein